MILCQPHICHNPSDAQVLPASTAAVEEELPPKVLPSQKAANGVKDVKDVPHPRISRKKGQPAPLIFSTHITSPNLVVLSALVVYCHMNWFIR